MKNALRFDFTVDKSIKTVHIIREFDAALPLVWDAFTKQEILDQWSAPKPFAARTKSMDFRVGGRRLYAMVSPDGKEQYQVQAYTAIHPKTGFTYTSSFSDPEGNVDPQWPGSQWNLRFSESNGITTVHIDIFNESLARMEKMIEMGFREGFAATIENLEQWLKAR